VLFLEHVPSKSLVPPVSGRVCIDIPESPMGVATPSSTAVAAYLRGAGYGCVLPHIRVCDVNQLALLAITKAARSIGVWGLLITYGDPPAVGSCAGAFTSSIDAIEFVRRSTRSSPRLGAVLSLRYGMPELAARIRTPADFFLVMRLGRHTWDKFVSVAEDARALGKELIPYVIVRTESNRHVLASLNQPVVDMEDLGEWVGKVCEVTNNVLLSLPEALVEEVVQAVDIAEEQCFSTQKR